MKLQRVFFFFFAVNALTFVALPRFAKADEVRQLQGCNEVNQPPLPASDAAYRDAMALAQTLIKRRFVVTCMSPSKMTGTFEGQDGAAVYRTNQGDFEALFLPHPKNFDKLQVIESQDGQRYRYSFVGPPEPWPANLIDSAFRLYFVKHGSELIVAEDQQVAARVRSAIDRH